MVHSTKNPEEVHGRIECPSPAADRASHMEQLIRWVAVKHGLPEETVFCRVLPADPFGELKRAIERRGEHITQLVEENERLGSVSTALDIENRAMKEAAKGAARELQATRDSLLLLDMQIRAMGGRP